jgi:hypothetical protein
MFVIPFWIDYTVPVLVYAFALLRGSAPERSVAVLCSLFWLHDNVIDPYRLGERLPFQLAKDIVETAVFLGLALSWNRWWLLGASMLGLLQIATDVVDMILHLHGWTFGTARWTWSWIFLATLFVGTCASPRRRAHTAGRSETQVRHTTCATRRSRRSVWATWP